MMKYGKAYGGEDPERVEGDVFRIIVKYPDSAIDEEDSVVTGQVEARLALPFTRKRGTRKGCPYMVFYADN